MAGTATGTATDVDVNVDDMATGGINDVDIAPERPNERKRSQDDRGESGREEEDDGDRKRPRPGETEGSPPGVRPSLQLFLEVKPWQPVIIPPHPVALGNYNTQEEDIHLIIRMQHVRHRREVFDGVNRITIGEKYPSPREWPEPNVLGRLDQLGIQPRYWNSWIKVIDVDDIMVAVCKCYKTEPWVQEKIKLTQDDINWIESWIAKHRWKLSSSPTGKRDDLRQFVIKCLVLTNTEGREKLKTMIEATKNGSVGSSDTILSIFDLSQLPVKKWYPVGLELGVKEDNLKNISKEFKKEEYAVCMFDDWLRNHAREACYPPMKLVAVLLDAGEMESARMVCQQYNIQCEPGPPVLPTLQDLCSLPLVENEWCEVGEQLGVSEDDLDSAAECDDPQQEMFRRCLERKQCQAGQIDYENLFKHLFAPGGSESAETLSGPELPELTKALYAVGDPELAEKIIQEHKVRVLNIPHPSCHNEHIKIHWHKFGKSLGFNVQDIKGKHSEIIKKWLERNPNATYDMLVNDLSEIGDHKGARSVCRKFGIRLPDASVVALYGRTITRQPQVKKSTSKEGPARNVGKGIRLSDASVAVLYGRKTITRQPQVKPANRALSNSQGQSVEDIKPKIWDLSDVITQSQGEWKDLARHLHFENFEVIAIEKDNKGVRDMCGEMLGKWLEGQGKRGPRTWGTLLQALSEMGKTELVKELKQSI